MFPWIWINDTGMLELRMLSLQFTFWVAGNLTWDYGTAHVRSETITQADVRIKKLVRTDFISGFYFRILFPASRTTLPPGQVLIVHMP